MEKETDGKQKHLSDADWADIRARFEAGHEVKGLAEEFGLARSSIYKKAKRQGWLSHGTLKKTIIDKADTKAKEILLEEEVSQRVERGRAQLKALDNQNVLNQGFQQAIYDSLDRIREFVKREDEKARNEGRPRPLYPALGKLIYENKANAESLVLTQAQTRMILGMEKDGLLYAEDKTEFDASDKQLKRIADLMEAQYGKSLHEIDPDEVDLKPFMIHEELDSMQDGVKKT